MLPTEAGHEPASAFPGAGTLRRRGCPSRAAAREPQRAKQ